MAPFCIPLSDRPPPFGGRAFIHGLTHLPPSLRGVSRPPGVWFRQPLPMEGLPDFCILRDAWGVGHPPPAEEWIPLWRNSRPAPPANPWASP